MMKIANTVHTLSVAMAFLTGNNTTNAAVPKYQLTPASEVKWTPLNRARGAQSPMAGNLWGDRGQDVATGFLVKFVDGFSSPPHIHNVTYRGVVLQGLVHNDDPEAAEMWMPAGSYWTQPAGEAHITSAKGATNVAYIEIEKGPYLVLSTEQANDNGERPINVHRSNLVWVDPPSGAKGSKIAYLWGKPEPGQANGTLLNLPAGQSVEIRANSRIRAVVVEGQSEYSAAGKSKPVTLDPGSHFSSTGKASHRVSCGPGIGCVVYVRAAGRYDLVSLASGD